ncbi:hypothetical protein GCM10010405_43470 [Streptomyces macrosporus]|uniref:Uncharacterized protein n=1 Tax=Streptomyces macrosporus TaxID=44032 RepID=A0ABN3KBB5_9ACTN
MCTAPPLGTAVARRLHLTSRGRRSRLARAENDKGRQPGALRLYDVDLARPKRVPTLNRAVVARQTCLECKRRYFHALKCAELWCRVGDRVRPAGVGHTVTGLAGTAGER